MKKKIALVLEGGGMRGAYTAGCLSWLLHQNLEFDYHYGISTGAVHLCSFLLKQERYLKELSTHYIVHKNVVGIRPFFREGSIVGYNYLFDELLPNIYHFDNERLLSVAQNTNAKIGIYDLDICKTIYKDVKDIDVEMQYLKAAATLPVIGKIVKIDNHQYLDGGITDMIPIQEAIKDGCDKFLVITTKPEGYVRKAAGKFLTTAMRCAYPKHKQIYEDYKARHRNYNQQIELIQSKVNEGVATYCFPSQNPKVSRIRGNEKDLLELYELGIKDCEARKEEILKLFS